MQLTPDYGHIEISITIIVRGSAEAFISHQNPLQIDTIAVVERRNAIDEIISSGNDVNAQLSGFFVIYQRCVCESSFYASQTVGQVRLRV